MGCFGWWKLFLPHLAFQGVDTDTAALGLYETFRVVNGFLLGREEFDGFLASR